ncbi:MAG: hypothetical protein HZB39_10840 [Planctomycetes bacterium]|nr:hypothetical protein [Planctomycetota bacterium]
MRDLAEVCNREAAEFDELLEQAGGDELRFVALAVERGLASENDAYRVWARRLGVDFDPLDERTLSPQSLHRLPIDVGRRFGAVVVGEADGLLRVALSNPYDVLSIDAIQEATRSPIDIALATPSSIERALARQARGLTGIEKMIAQIAKAEVGADVLSNPEKLKQIAGEDAVVQLSSRSFTVSPRHCTHRFVHASRSSPGSTSASDACRRTAVTCSAATTPISNCGCRRCPASSARRW